MVIILGKEITEMFKLFIAIKRFLLLAARPSEGELVPILETKAR